jgi:hypothetical protein
MSGAGQRITEKDFQRQVVDLARILGYVFIYHAQLSKWSEKGWPDLVLVRTRAGHERIIYAELKSERGVLTERQAVVLGYLEDAGAEVYVWRPSDIALLQQVLA